MTETLVDMALEAAGLAVLVLDETGRIIETTRSVATLLKRPPEDLIGRPIASVLPIDPAVAPDVRDEAAQAPPKVIKLEISDAQERHDALAVNLVHWVDPAGNRRTSAILRDYSSEAELARIAQRDLIRSDHAIQGANIGVFEYDLRTEAVSVSPIWRKLLELEPSENIDVQAEWRSRVHPDDLAGALEPIRLCGEDLAERARCEYRLMSRDRTQWRWMQTDIAVALRDAAGKPTTLVGAQTDITERKNTEEALLISLEEFRMAFEHASIGKAIVALDGRWLRLNPAYCSLLGYDEAELLASDFQSVTHPDDLERDLSNVRALLAGEISTYRIDKRYIRADGEIIWVHLAASLVRDPHGQPMYFIAQVADITEQRRLDQMKSEFVSVVTHELRTPLTAILGSLTLLAHYDDNKFPDEIQRLLFIAKTNGDRLHQLIDDILDFQKFSARQMRLSLTRLPVANLVEETLLVNMATADRNRVKYASTIADRAMTGMVDRKRFHQVMANLLSNATKFATPGTVVEVRAERLARAIRVTVSNMGPGIPESFRDRIFTPFSQAGSVSGRRAGGTGLGLSITKQIVEQMGGDIGFDSETDGMTTFWFTLRPGEGPGSEAGSPA
ncbi:PAS domain S-box protein [bacterium]|nr:PAS domain S-box protein [bacterium]